MGCLPMTEGEKTMTSFPGGFAHYAGSCNITIPFQTTLKDIGEGKSSQWAELQAVDMVFHFVWKKR